MTLKNKIFVFLIPTSLVLTLSLLTLQNWTKVVEFSKPRVNWVSMPQKQRDLGPVKKIAFLKTHKTASSSIQNIILRYGLYHNLTFVLPSRGNHLLGEWHLFLRDVPWHQKLVSTNQYDVIALHTRWNYDRFKFVVGPDAAFFTILRNPLDVFESLFSYCNFERKLQLNITEYLKLSKDPTFRAIRINGHVGLNQQLFDLSVDLDLNSVDKRDIGWHIRQLSQQFDLVLIAEYMDESLVLLSHLLRVPLNEVVSLKVNARKEENKIELSKNDQENLAELQSEEIKLYDYFERRLLNQIQLFGISRMAKEVEELRRLQKSAYDYCVLFETDGETLKGTHFEPYSSKTIAYRVREDDEDCVKMAMSEIKFIDFVRNKQFAQFSNKASQS